MAIKQNKWQLPIKTIKYFEVIQSRQCINHNV